MENNNSFVMTEKVVSNLKNWSRFGSKEYPDTVKDIKITNCELTCELGGNIADHSKHNLFVSNSTFHTLNSSGNDFVDITIKAFEKNKEKKNMYIELDPKSKSKDVMAWIFYADHFSDNNSIEQLTIKNARILCLDLCKYPNLKKINFVNCNIRGLEGPEKLNSAKFNFDGCKMKDDVLKRYGALSEKEKTVLPKQVEMSI